MKAVAAARARSSFGPREAARRVGRDVKAVHGDIRAPLDAGVLDKDERDGIVFPYDRVHVDFMLTDAV